MREIKDGGFFGPDPWQHARQWGAPETARGAYRLFRLTPMEVKTLARKLTELLFDRYQMSQPRRSVAFDQD